MSLHLVKRFVVFAISLSFSIALFHSLCLASLNVPFFFMLSLRNCIRSSPHFHSLKFNTRAKKFVRIFFQIITKQSRKWNRETSFLGCRVRAVTFVFHFYWVLQPSQEKLKRKLMQKSGGQIRCIVGNVEEGYLINLFSFRGTWTVVFFFINYG